jgi:hypothetical protein
MGLLGAAVIFYFNICKCKIIKLGIIIQLHKITEVKKKKNLLCDELKMYLQCPANIVVVVVVSCIVSNLMLVVHFEFFMSTNLYFSIDLCVLS